MESGVIQQSGVIPFRIRKGELEVAIVSSRTGKRWWIPKGHLEDDLTQAESAAVEAWEEAGLVGETFDYVIGQAMYRKRKEWRVISMYPMLVSVAFDIWPECRQRKRKWVRVDQLERYISHQGVVRAVHQLEKFHRTGTCRDTLQLVA